MTDVDLNALKVFAKVVEAGSLSEGARRLKMPVSTVSRRVAELEDQLGIRLLERSTRNMRLTAAGAEVLEQARRSVDISDAVAGIACSQRPEVAGTLRLSTPPSIADSLVMPVVGAFLAAYPEVEVQIFATDRTVDHIAEGVDLAFHAGALRDSSLVARKVLTFRHQLVASPTYLRQYPAPERPQDVLRHRVVAFARWGQESRWQFTHVNGREREAVTLVPHVGINEYAGVVAGLLLGLGIGDLPPIVAPGLLRDGRLVEIMPEWRFPPVGLHLMHLSNRHSSRAVRLFKELAAHMVPTLFPDLPA